MPPNKFAGRVGAPPGGGARHLSEHARCGPAPPQNGERGSAVVEFTFLVTLMLVPVIYLVLTVSNLQAGSFASVGAAGQAAKVFATAQSAQEGRLMAERAVLLAVTDHGFDESAVIMDVRCEPAPCLEPGSVVTVEVNLRVHLPLVPMNNGLSLAAATVSASATEVVTRFG